MIPGHRNDITQAPALIEGYSYEYVIGDKAYDSDAFIAEITSREAIAVIPPRKNRTEPRTYDKELYKRRNLIERFFGWLKQYRRVATRYDKLSVRYLGFVYFAAILITTHKMHNLVFMVRFALVRIVFQELDAASRRSRKITEGRIRRRRWQSGKLPLYK